MKKFVVFAAALILLGGSLSVIAATVSAEAKAAAEAKKVEIAACKNSAKDSYNRKMVNIEKIRKDFTKTQQETLNADIKAAQVVYKAAIKKAQDEFAASKKVSQTNYKSALDLAKTTMKANVDEYKAEFNTAKAECDKK